MEHCVRTRESLIKHFLDYPKAQITDIFKYLHQSSLGCGHMVASEDSAIDYISREHASMTETKTAPVVTLDGEYSRVSLSWLDGGLCAKTLGKLFFLSAKEEPDGKTALLSKLETARELVKKGELPFSIDEFERQLSNWQNAGFPAVRHSEKFREAYAPSYRVIGNEYVKFLPLLARIDKSLSIESTLTVAIEGGSASGKTTLSALFSALYDCTVFHMDDFFLRPEQRTKERLSEVGGNVDRERFFDEVLKPLSQKKTVVYRRFDCGTQKLEPPITVEPKKLVIIEGAYSMHPSLAQFYDLSVFLSIEPKFQKERILKRNTPALAKRFFDTWIPMEQKYFKETNAAERCDLVL